MDMDPAVEKLPGGDWGTHEGEGDKGHEKGDQVPGGQERQRHFWLNDEGGL